MAAVEKNEGTEKRAGAAGAAGAAGSEPVKAVTPMMAQYMEIKKDHPGALLFYRMGDFYELFFEDAVKAAEALDITLTKRGKHLGEDIPMCGVPVHSADAYLERLIRLSFKVAICEQTEDPAEAKKRGAKSVVRREVVRLVTPGTLTEDTLLDARRHNYLAALSRLGASDTLSLAWADISTGDFRVTSIAPGELGAERSVSGFVYKISTLILYITVAVRDTGTGKLVEEGSVSIRGNTDESWRHGLQSLLERQIFKDGKLE
jgi:DNA mismatch repair protein MutS